ncbi:MAG: CoA transferase [Pseudomonadota bacterium]
MQTATAPGTHEALARRSLREALASAGVAGGGAQVVFTDAGKIIRTPYAVEGIGAGSFAAVGAAVERLWRLRQGRAQQVVIDIRKAALALRASRYLRVDGRNPGLDFKDPYTGYYPTADGRWVLLHCNFAPARDGNLAVLGMVPGDTGTAQRVAGWSAAALEEALFAAGGCGAMVRTPEEWALLPQARAVAQEPLVHIEKIGEAPPRPLPPGLRPLAGLRVLDLTRVVAGPSCARIFAEHGAEVLKITRADLPASGVLDIETGIGKRAAHLDLRDPAQAETLRGLVRQADVFCQSYRPGALDTRGLAAADLARLRPGIVYATLNAWGQTGPWRARRGYDTVLQAASGITGTQAAGGPPVQQPVSALDYIAGNLMAFGALEALARRCTEGGSWRVHVSLARVAQWIIGAGLCSAEELDAVPADLPEATIESLSRHIAAPMGRVRYLAPIVGLSGTPPALLTPPLPLGSSAPAWAA